MLYQDYGKWLRAELGSRIQKISIDAGLTCPNRDGRVGWGGCSFCNNRAFSPAYCREGATVTEQLELGKRFFARKYHDMRYLAYFQAYTSTYGDVGRCIALYEEALRVEGVVGMVIGTRPDSVPDEMLDYLERLNRRTFLMVEYGVESASDDTLKRINRGHTYADSVEAVNRTAARGIRVGAHVILGLPGETRADLLRQAAQIGRLPLTALKLHQLQIVRDTPLERQWRAHPWPMPTVEEYIDLVIDYMTAFAQSRRKALPALPPCVCERFVSSSPASLRLAPQWGLKPHEFSVLLQKRLEARTLMQNNLEL